jgi:hypothetical protein
MAEAEGGSNSFFDSIEQGIKEYWPWILVFIAGYFIVQNNLQIPLIRVILPVFGVIVLGRIAWKLWVHYVQQEFISGIDFVLLEIIPPREVLRSPKAMELFFTNALYHWSEKGGRESYWQGAVWFWFSLEIVSIEGQVHFYIRTPTRVRSLIETQMYAQYPQAQVKAVEDYTLAVDEISPKSSWMGWGCEWGLEKPEAFPIKTYVDFGLDKDPKEEFKVDPLSPLIELFGAIGKGEQVWLQIVVTPSKKEFTTGETRFGKHNWVKESELQVYKVLAPYSSFKEVKTAEEIGIGRSRKEIRVPPHLDDVIKKMRLKPSKLGFDTGIRLMYVAKKEAYSMETRRNIRLIFRQFSDPNSNAFSRTNATQGDAFGSTFVGLSSEQVMVLADRMLHEYRERGFFHLPFRHIFNEHRFHWIPMMAVKQFFLPYFHPPTYVLNVEELATIWHFPGQILKVPTLERIESKEASPPTNLPM